MIPEAGQAHRFATTRMPMLESERLVIRPFVMADLDAARDLLDVQLAAANVGTEGVLSRVERERWLQWSVLNEEALAYLKQPPFGDRAIVLKETGALVGVCGYVPCIGPYGQLLSAGDTRTSLFSSEFGLHYAVSPARQRQGVATEAAQLLVAYGFERLKLGRIVATTSYENAASMRVMEKLGMRIERNPHSEPSWFQVVGILDHPATRT
jgi:RimJ/RimL family protein N-acetyltransferase